MNSTHLLHAHWKKLDLAQQFKAVTTRMFNKTKLKEVINWHINNNKQNFVAQSDHSLDVLIQSWED